MTDPNKTPHERCAEALEKIEAHLANLTFNLTSLDGKPVIILTDEGSDVVT